MLDSFGSKTQLFCSPRPSIYSSGTVVVQMRNVVILVQPEHPQNFEEMPLRPEFDGSLGR